MPLVFRGESWVLTVPLKQWQFVVLLSFCPTVSASEVELQGQRKPPILSWKEVIIYHLVIQRDWVTRAEGRKLIGTEAEQQEVLEKLYKHP